MDDHVLRGMMRWPDVPAVFGWLALDRRGNWLLRNEPITNASFSDYIGRNYERDACGRWFFQNGPQRVYVELDYTPYVYRALRSADAPLEIEAHTGARATALCGAWMDENGTLLLETEHGVGVVHDRDLEATLPSLVDADGTSLDEAAIEGATMLLQQGRQAAVWISFGASNVKLEPVRSDTVPARFGYVSHPAEREGDQAIAAAR